MNDIKVPFFQPFDSIKEGFDELFEVIKKVNNIDDRTKLLVIYGCLGQTVQNEIPWILLKKGDKNED